MALPAPSWSAAVVSDGSLGAKLPFIANRGQVHDPAVAFHTHGLHGDSFVRHDGEIVYRVRTHTGARSWVLKEQLIGASQVRAKGIGKSGARIYFHGPGQGGREAASIPAYRAVGWREVYPDIDLELRRNHNSIEKVLTVRPGGDPARITWRIDGAGRLEVNEDGELLALTGYGPVHFSRPLAYQEIDGARREVRIQYAVDGDRYGFRLGRYDADYPLVIDPLLAATYLGSADDDADFASLRMVYDAGANEVVVAGTTQGLDFPTSTGAYDASANGNVDIFVARLSSDLSTLSAATYLGGASEDRLRDIAVSASGNVIIGGDTVSTDFPVTAGVIKSAKTNYRDALVATLSNDLSTLVASTLFGDTGTECASSGSDYGAAIAVDASGNIYLAGNTTSQTLPVTSGAYQETISTGYAGFPCGHDAYVVKMNASLTSVLAATYYGTGGNSNLSETVTGIALDSSNNVYISGWAPHATLPVSVSGGDFSGGVSDAYLARFSNDLSDLQASRYLGGSTRDTARDLRIDSSNNVFVVGETTATDFPTTAGAFLETVPPATPSGASLGWAVRLDNTFGIDAATYLYRAVPGQLTLDTGTSNGEVVLVGPSGTDFPYPADAYDPFDDGISPAKLFVGRFNLALSALHSATTLHGQASQIAVATDTAGNVFVAGVAVTPDGRDAIDLTGTPYDATHNGGNDVFVAKLSAGLNGTGTLQASPASHDFAAVEVPVSLSTVYPSTDIILTNTGSAWLEISSVSLTGTDAAYFDIDANTCNTTPRLRPQAMLPDVDRSCTITLNFRPLTTQAGTWTAQLQIDSSDPATPVTSVSLSGQTQVAGSSGGSDAGDSGSGSGDSGGGGGGGCTVNPHAPFDPILPLLIGFAIAVIAYRRIVPRN